ncbi:MULTISPECIES: hypothetical protein [Paraburkholderia]|uniref:Glycoside hydrolase family 55 protein n=1 Tax=Paraburkholderia madseniana TaxID=2599607 RepID=A0AAP5BIL0_9BURK|nr:MULTISPECIES: hypothetical protein [Paraburkholderia]MCX4149418.1 hypothetical protein [Paraburkholderia madseniana]MDN7152353.1 glycoside hydrolase family 55 protein [Paraburkholderia sp. WS6]MDQ6411235.1 glycoside hydrolase family 55 protein [Paraburkholderia madseniana]
MDPIRRAALARLAQMGIGVAYFSRISRTRAAETNLAAPQMKVETLLEDENFSARARGGARGDNKTDDTVALQAWINYLVANHKRGTLGAGTYRISAPLIIPAGYEWAIDGDIAGATRILQTTDNVPILNIDPTGPKPLMHTWRISNIEFDYMNDQPASNENANPILFSQMVCEFSLTNLRFSRGSYAIKVKPGIGGPWGGDWDGLVFAGKLSGGAMDWTGAVNAVPNNRWGRFFVECHSMAGPVFRNIKGYNWTIDTIEFIAANRGAQLISMQPGTVCTIGAMKLENGIYRDNQNLIALGPACHVDIGQFCIGGNAMILNPAHGTITLFATGVGGATGNFELGTLVADATELGENVFLISGDKGGMRIKDMVLRTHPWQICDNLKTVSGETLTISQYKNDRLSENLGDSNYSIKLGDPNLLSFESKFTAPRSIDLPDSLNQLFNGLYYEIRADGAVREPNTLTVRCGGDAKYVIKTDKTIVRFTWRRASSATAGWILTNL